MLPGWICTADPAQPLTTADEELDDLDQDHDLCIRRVEFSKQLYSATCFRSDWPKTSNTPLPVSHTHPSNSDNAPLPTKKHSHVTMYSGSGG